jgi:hypothetical protein
MTSKELLTELFERAQHYDFPVLDNAYWKLISGRLRGFRQGSDVALVFEMFIFQTQAQAFLVNIYAYGTLIGGTQGDVGAFPAISEAPHCPLWDDQGEWRPNLPSRTVSVNETLLSVVNDPRILIQDLGSIERIVLSEGDAADEAAFGRAIAREIGLSRVMPEKYILETCPSLANATEIVRLSNWDHPDVIAGQPPSDSVAITQVAALLAGERDSISYDHKGDNVYWRFWDSC